MNKRNDLRVKLAHLKSDFNFNKKWNQVLFGAKRELLIAVAPFCVVINWIFIETNG